MSIRELLNFDIFSAAALSSLLCDPIMQVRHPADLHRSQDVRFDDDRLDDDNLDNVTDSN